MFFCCEQQNKTRLMPTAAGRLLTIILHMMFTKSFIVLFPIECINNAQRYSQVDSTLFHNAVRFIGQAGI